MKKNFEFKFIIILICVLNFSLNSKRQIINSLSLNKYDQLIQGDNTIVTLDTRNYNEVSTGFIPGSIVFPIKKNIMKWIVMLFDINTKFIFVINDQEIIKTLSINGYKNVIGYLKGGFKNWLRNKRGFAKVENVKIEENIFRLIKNNSHIIDVREEKEVLKTGIIPNSKVYALSQLLINTQSIKNEISDKRNVYIFCFSGKRAMIAISLLIKNGVNNKLINLKGGLSKILIK